MTKTTTVNHSHFQPWQPRPPVLVVEVTVTSQGLAIGDVEQRKGLALRSTDRWVGSNLGNRHGNRQIVEPTYNWSNCSKG